METVIRVAIIYLVIVAGLRVLGKREFGQLSPLELVSLLLIPEIVSQAIIGEDFSLTNALIALTTLFSLVFITSVLMHLNQKWESVLTGQPSVLVYHGQLLEKTLNRERIAPSEIFDQMHKSGLERLEQVKWALLGTDGKIAIIPEDIADQRMAGAKDETHI